MHIFESMLRCVVITSRNIEIQNFCANVIKTLGLQDSNEVSLLRLLVKPLKLRILSVSQLLKANLGQAAKERYARQEVKRVSLYLESFNLVDVVPALKFFAKKH